MGKSWALMIVALAATLLPGEEARAAVIYNNLGAGTPAFNTSTGHSIIAWSFFDQDVAAPFTVPSGPNYTLDTIEMAVRRDSGTNILSVGLYSDNAGVPGTELATVNLSGAVPSSSAAVVAFPFTVTPHLFSPPTLSAGATYWVVASATFIPSSGGDRNFAWMHNNTGDAGMAFRFDGGSWDDSTTTAAAFRVNGNLAAVPEPSTAALACVAAIAALTLARRRT